MKHAPGTVDASVEWRNVNVLKTQINIVYNSVSTIISIKLHGYVLWSPNGARFGLTHFSSFSAFAEESTTYYSTEATVARM